MKKNPKSVTATQLDVKQAHRKGIDRGSSMAIVIMLTVLLDKEGADKEMIQRVWSETNSLSQSIIDGYVSLFDLRRVLREEYEIEV